eukprot:gene46828-57339_t
MLTTRRFLGHFGHKNASFGLFGLGADFSKPQNFEVQAKRAIEVIGNIKSLLMHHWAPGARPNNSSLDAKTEACRNLHTDETFIEASQNAFSTMSAFIAQLNQDQELYSVISHLFTLKDTLQLSQEERIFLDDLQSDFNCSGVHLPPSQQEAVLQLSQKIGELESEFIGNVSSHDFARVPFGPISSAVDREHWGRVIAQHYPASPSPPFSSSSWLSLPLDRRLLQ